MTFLQKLLDRQRWGIRPTVPTVPAMTMADAIQRHDEMMDKALDEMQERKRVLYATVERYNIPDDHLH